MNLPVKISVVTIVNDESLIVYQQVYVNNPDVARVDFNRQYELHKSDIMSGWNILLRHF